jgi:hypothetical protein
VGKEGEEFEEAMVWMEVEDSYLPKRKERVSEGDRDEACGARKKLKETT